MQDASDVLIIGSGPAAVMAALPIVESGRTVTMIDGGMTAPAILEEPLRDDFIGMRRNREDQWRWFLGEDLGGIPVRGLEGGLGGGMTSGNRAYVTAGTGQLPLESQNAQIIQSLARGGLGAVWGATCAYLESSELETMGMPAADIQKQYDEVSELVGISGPQTRAHVQPPLTPDHHAARLLKSAEKKWMALDNMHIRVMQPHSAVLTQEKNNRKAEQYRDMDYYSDDGRTVWRPQFLLDRLMSHPNFRYVPRHLIDHVEETGNEAIVFARVMDGDRLGETKRFTGKRVVMAAGTIGSARLLLKSLGLHDARLPLLIKPHVFTACLDTASLGQAGPRERTSLCQLLITDGTKTGDGFDSAVAQLYGYRSLLLFRLLGSMPLPIPRALKALAALSPSLVVADIRFPVHASSQSHLSLDRGGRIRIIAEETADERTERREALKRIHKASKMLGLLPAKTLWLPHGSTSHYAGTIPYRDEPGTTALSVNRHGKLHQGKHLYVADAATFTA
ncbi:MAG TPA: hypothetical protein VHA78_01405, partial [Candidatus Peribacteraceae bacterium]|nr:hypothetical protein [Candidatus Peribacteraceae bacterium]